MAKGKKSCDLLNTYSKSITVNVLPSDFKRLERFAAKRGTSKMQIVREAISAYLK